MLDCPKSAGARNLALERRCSTSVLNDLQARFALLAAAAGLPQRRRPQLRHVVCHVALDHDVCGCHVVQEWHHRLNTVYSCPSKESVCCREKDSERGGARRRTPRVRMTRKKTEEYVLNTLVACPERTVVVPISLLLDEAMRRGVFLDVRCGSLAGLSALAACPAACLRGGKNTGVGSYLGEMLTITGRHTCWRCCPE